ncbi:MAG TPA: hypothetical protein VK858_08335, partial [Longimicrobiales bacterium]|nr:hypothetical protein [Longimicrobiales bacterium]
VEGDEWDGGGMFLVPLGDHVFTPGSEEGGLVRTPEPERRVRFTEADDGGIDAAELTDDGTVRLRLERAESYTPPPEALRRWAGSYAGPALPPGIRVEAGEGALLVQLAGPASRFRPLSPTRFVAVGDGPGPPAGTVFSFAEEDGETVLRIVAPDGFEARLVRER